MKFERYEDIKEYCRQVEDFLLKEEVSNNLPLGIIYSLRDGTDSLNSEEPPILGLVRDGRDINLTALITPPYNLVLAGRAEDGPLFTAVNYLLENAIEVPGVVGENRLAARFARIWSEEAGCNNKIAMKQRIYILERVNELDISQGRLRKAGEGDFKLLQKWFIGSSQDIFAEEISEAEAGKKVRTALDKSSLYLWEDGQAVSMAAWTRPTRNGVVINEVYTPEEYRDRGYATACVLSLSRLLLNEGYRFCSLYTDLSNPTSNSIYQRIGYQPVSDALVYDFTD